MRDWQGVQGVYAMVVMNRTKEAVMQALRQHGSVLLPTPLDPDRLEVCLEEARHLAFEERPQIFGPRQVQQVLANAKVEPRSALDILANEL